MVTANKIALQNIRHQGFRSTVLLFLILIASTSILGVGIFTQNMKLGIEDTKKRVVADIIAVPSDYQENAKDALFEGKTCTILFKENPVKKIKKINGVKNASAQLYLATLPLDCCSAAGVQIVAIDIHSDFTIGRWLKSRGINTLKKDEIVVGSACGLKKKQKIDLYGETFKVVEVLDESGLGYDESVFLTYEAANQITKNQKYKDIFNGQSGLASMILIKVKPDFNTTKIKNSIIKELSGDGGTAYATSQITEKLLKQLSTFKIFGNVTNFFVILLATASMFALITISFYQQRNRVGSLLAVGIGKRKIIRIYILEYVYITILGLVSAIILVSIFLFPLHTVIKHEVDLPYKFLGIRGIILLVLKTIITNIVILLLSTSFSFYKIIKTEPALLAEEHI